MSPNRSIVPPSFAACTARLAMSSQLGGWQVAVIDPAEAMNVAAQNALLKTLEEPTDATLMVLVSDQPWRLSATIRSRCQRVEFANPPPPAALAWLSARGVAHADAVLSAAGGNPGQAWLLAEQGGMQRRQEVARDLLALAAGRARAREVGKGWANDEPAQRLEQAARLLDDALRARLEGRKARFDPGWDNVALADGFAAAKRLRLRLNGPLRTDLALFEWLDGLPHG